MTDDEKILVWCGWGSYGKPIDPEIDLDFLFGDAVPKMKRKLSPLKLQLWLGGWIMRIVYHNEDSVEAFKTALIKVIDDR